MSPSKERRTIVGSGVQNLGVDYIKYLSWDPASAGPDFNPEVARHQITFDPGQSFLGRLEVVSGGTHPGPPYREGGSFLQYSFQNQYGDPQYGSAKSEPLTTPHYGHFFSTVWIGEIGYVGGFYPSYIGGTLTLGESEKLLFGELEASTKVNWSPSDIQNFGNRAWSKLRPKADVASLAQFIYELKDAPGMLKTTAQGFHRAYIELTNTLPRHLRQAARDAKSMPKGIANHFLNHEFGWLPFVSDVNKLTGAVINFTETVAKLQSSNGQWQTKRFSEPVKTEESILFSENSLEGAYTFPSLGPNYLASQGYSVRRQFMSRMWYTGRFMMYRPEFDTELDSGYPALNTVNQALTIFGGRITPTLVYRVMPWTWLLDWFTGTADFVQRIEDSMTNNVVCDAFYLMRDAYERLIYRYNAIDRSGSPLNLEWQRSLRVKRREKGDGLFSFSAGPGDLSGMQAAILTALGLSRLRP